MAPFVKFLDSARRLIPMGMTRQQIFNFAKQEFGEVNQLMKKQIDNLFKPKKLVGKKDPDFDSTVEKMQFDDMGKPFNPRDPLKNYSKELTDSPLDDLKKIVDDFKPMGPTKKAEGGRIGYAMGSEGIMQMASVDDPFYRSGDEDEHSFRMFNKPYKELNADELEDFREEMMRLMNKFSAREKEDMKMASYGYDDAMGESFEEFLRLKKLKEIPMDMEFDEYLDQLDIDIPYSKKDRGAPSIKLADGGITRIGLKDGPKDPRRRGFMKAAVGIASMLPFGIGKGVKVAAPVVKKAAEMSEPALAKIVETVMSAGKLISITGKRVKDMVTKRKLKNVEVEEDIADGSYIIKKDGKEIYYKPGRMDETGGIDDSIIEVIEDTVTKKAGGGIARMLGE